MKNINLKILIQVLIVIVSFSSFLNAQPTSPEQLKEELKEAMKTKNKEKISALFYWEGVSDEGREFSKSNIDKMAEYPAKEIKILPLPDGLQTEIIEGSYIYMPNVKLVGIFQIIYGEDGPPTFTDAQIPYGIIDGKYYLPNTIAKPVVNKVSPGKK